MATIAIDYDDTYTLDPTFWDQCIAIAKSCGHRVLCVTCRRDTDENREEVVVPGVPVFFTGLTAKRWYLETVWNIRVDVWIDNRPEHVLNGV